MRLLDGLSALLVGGGALFFVAGTVGLLRFPDTLSRLHAVGKADSAGLALVVLGLLLRADSFLTAFKLVFIWGLVVVATALGGQLIGRAAAHEAQEPPQRQP
jgi:multicomponent Na+:H+ antiporter subunit G